MEARVSPANSLHSAAADPVALPPMPLDVEEITLRRRTLLAMAEEARALSFAEAAERWGFVPPSPPEPRRPSDAGLNAHQKLLAEAARARGLRAEAVPGQRVTYHPQPFTALAIETPAGTVIYHHQVLSWAGPDGRVVTPVNGPATFDLMDKARTRHLLGAAGVPILRGAVFRRSMLADALACAAEEEGELCVKPIDGSNGDLVQPCLRTAEDIRDAIVRIGHLERPFLMEESVAGEAWRFFYVRPEVVGIKLGRPASVVGNGFNTVRDLVAIADADRVRRAVPGHSGPLGDDPVQRAIVLRRQRLDETDVPERGRRVFLSSLSNGSRGADSLARPDAVHPRLVERVKRAIEAVSGVQEVAADVIIGDPGDPEAALSFLEINAGPSLLAYHHPAEGPVQDVAGALADLLTRLTRS